jgi:hypothetical protein
VLLTIEQHRASDHGGIAGEALVPQRVAQHHDA